MVARLISCGLSLAIFHFRVFSAAVPISPFAVEGYIQMEAFRPDQIAPYITSEAQFSFVYSNGWWRVATHYLNPNVGELAEESCMRIPDGVRLYSLFQGDERVAMTPAEVCSTAFPPPGSRLLFDTWLAFCPNPELPIIDESRMRRFLNVPTCWPDLENHPENEGRFDLTYFTPDKLFIKRLSITNNGISLGIGSDNRSEVRPFPPPFDDGFLEFRYEADAATNVGGWTFPDYGESKRYRPDWKSGKHGELYLSSVSHLRVDHISVGGATTLSEAPLPWRLLALDSRPPGLPNDRTVDYIVTNDQWKPVSDPWIKHLANIVRRTERKSTREFRGLWTVLLFLLGIVPPLVFLLIRHRKKDATKTRAARQSTSTGHCSFGSFE